MSEPTAPVLTMPCPTCGSEMARTDTIRVDGENRPLYIDCYKCFTPECQRKACVFFEPSGGLVADEPGIIEREIARTGAFFPHTVTQGMGRWGKFGR